MLQEVSVTLALMIVLTFSATSCANDQLVYPLDVAVGPNEEVYIADRKLPGIWKVVDGKLEVFVKASKTFRTPLNAVRCVTVDSDGTVYVGDSSTREVYAIGEDRKPLPLSDGHIGIASDLLIDGDRLIVSDLETQRIWSLPKTGGEVQELAVIAGVRGLAHSSEGELVCVTTLEDPVRKIADDQTVSVIISGRPFEMPHHCVIAENEIFIADNYAGGIWKADLSGDTPPELIRSGAPLQKPVGICRFREGFLVADPHAREIFVLPSGEGEVTRLIKSE
ncbi:NHL repeat protein [Thalassoglobus neptunius]|uniref:NHL repeat protein n=1 Tax=Thalassoglobus neptunius TaxID=1938619 RepID=A0A5C5WHG5_9PLAN|nr:hypothetical protein [Thalassoglobus neptunius]TWT50100.1 NHL repeat protein [Thalassoglobus neptunius]